MQGVKGECKSVKFESSCGLEATGHTIAEVYFDKWTALSPSVHFFPLDGNLRKFSTGTYLILQFRCKI